MLHFFQSIEVPNWVKQPWGELQGLSLWNLLLFLLALLFGLMIRMLIIQVATVQMKRWMTRMGFAWAKELIHAVAAPLGTLGMVLFFALTIPLIEFHEKFLNIVFITLRILASVSAVWLIYRSIDIIAEYFAEKAARTETKLDDQLVPLMRRALKITTVLMGIIFVLQNLNVDVSSLLAGMAVGGLAFSLAAKDTVSNLFGSITIFADKPFSIGDQVSIAGIEGFVEHIGFRSTRIRTFQNSLVTVPNHKFTESIVDNFGLRHFRRVQTTLGIVYNTPPDQIDAFCQDIREIIAKHPKTRKDLYEVNLTDFGSSSFDILLYFFLKVPTWTEEVRMKHEIYLDIIRAAAHRNIDFAFPTRTLHLAGS